MPHSRSLHGIKLVINYVVVIKNEERLAFKRRYAVRLEIALIDIKLQRQKKQCGGVKQLFLFLLKF